MTTYRSIVVLDVGDAVWKFDAKYRCYVKGVLIQRGNGRQSAIVSWFDGGEQYFACYESVQTDLPSYLLNGVSVNGIV